MPAESARDFDALETQAERLMAIFRAAGYERVAPGILQPAAIFLDRVGEDIRSRTYVFTDLDGNELCLRPDLTIPVARIFLDRAEEGAQVSRLSYNGPAFRYQREPEHPMRPREFRQAGIECFGVADALAADLEVLGLTIEAVHAAGLSSMRLRLGDIGLFHSVIAALPMPQRWRDRVMHAYWSGESLNRLLKRLASRDTMAGAAPEPLLALIDPTDAALTQARINAYLEEQGIPLIGARGLDEIARRLMSAKADLGEAPLSEGLVDAVRDYLALVVPAEEAAAALRAFAARHGLAIEPAIAAFEARLDAVGKLERGRASIAFCADLGRRFEYYTGFVFEIDAADPAIPAPIASGGRYDRLVEAIGGRSVPAVGAAIYTERLLGAVSRARP